MHYPTTPVTRRDLLRITGASAIAVAASVPAYRFATAQESTPSVVEMAGSLADLGLPELTITVTDSGYEGLSSDATSGVYLVTVVNQTQNPAFVAFTGLPEGTDLATLLQNSAPEDATPTTGEAEMEGPPSWYYTAYLPGGVGVHPGETAQFAIRLQPGTYAVWAEDPASPLTPAEITVTGDDLGPTYTSEIESDFLIREIFTSRTFEFGYEGELRSGSQIVEIENNTDQPHFIEISRSPSPITREQAMQVVMSDPTASPVAGLPNPAEFEFVAFIGTQSTTTRQWHQLDLTDGTYVLTCWVPDPNNGYIPHAMEGMVDVLTVGAQQTMATPVS